MENNIKVGVIDNSDFIRKVLSIFLTTYKEPVFDLVLDLDTVDQINQLGNLKTVPEIILLDMDISRIKSIERTALLQQYFPNCAIILFTNNEDHDTIMECICAGARGYLKKNINHHKLAQVIMNINQGGGYISPSFTRKLFDYLQFKNNQFTELTKREQEIVEAILDGLSYKLAAYRYGISIDTVRDHIKRIYRKLKINSKGELSALIRV